ncbi:MAG TPA: hypothetical protein VEX86_16510 [Longimicrobium sp.]|nr:hypothetical protein [Longimicrobium sp.]
MRIPKRLISLLVAILLTLPHLARAQQIRSPVRIDSLIGGIVLHKPVRFQLIDVLARDTSVIALFKPVPRTVPGTAAYYRNRRDSVTLVLNRASQVAVLRNVLKQKGTDRLRLVLHDPNRSVLRTIYEQGARFLPAYRFQDTVEVTLKDLPQVCSVVTNIVYQSIHDLLRERLEQSARTQEPVSVDSLFELLLADRISDFIAQLEGGEVVGECLRTLEFLKWVRGRSADGFAEGGYEIAGGVHVALDRIAFTLASTLMDWSERDFEIAAIGYGDKVRVNSDSGIAVNTFNTGVPNVIHGSMEVYHAACMGDQLTGNTPIFMPSPIGHRVGSRAWNNCELGAVRAYVAATYLASKLPRERLHVRYATAGVSTSSDDDAQNRKVEITITVRSGRERDAPRRSVP